MPRKKTKKKTQANKPRNLGGWLILIIVLFGLSAIQSLYLLLQRLDILSESLDVSVGIYISSALLMVHFILMVYSIILLMDKRKSAIKISKIALIIGLIFVSWFYVLGRIIFYAIDLTILKGILNVLVNFVILMIIFSYFNKSQRVKKH